MLNGIADAAEDTPELLAQIRIIFPTALSGFSFLLFNLLCAPCFAAIGAIRRQMASASWTFFALGYQTIFAYVVSMIVFQLGTLFTSGIFTVATAIALILLAVVLFLLFRPSPKKYSYSSLAQASTRA